MMAKKKSLAVSVVMAATVLAAAVPALAQEALPGDSNEAVPEDRTLYFELAVEGEPPAGANFFAVAPGANTANLTDPGGDGVYNGSLLAPGGDYPRCVPVGVSGKNSPGEASYEIRYEPRFCFEDGDVFSAGYSFGGGEGTTSIDGGTTPNEITVPSEGTTSIGGGTTIVDEGTTPGTGETTGPSNAVQYEDGGGTARAAGIDLNDDGAVSETDGEFAAQTSDEGVVAAPAGESLPGTGAGVLPSTGGLVLPIAGLLAGALLLGGLLLRGKRFAR